MDDTGRASALALAVRAVSLGAAGAAVLLQRTRGVPPVRRLRLMARLTFLGVWNVLPPRWAVASASGGLFACLGSLLLGLALTVVVVPAIPPSVPHPTEAYEGIGDALMAQLDFGSGAAMSLTVALCTGMAVGAWVASRWR